MKVWKCQAVVKDPNTNEILARGIRTDPQTGEQEPAYKYVLPETAKQWIANAGKCSARTEIIDGKATLVKDGIDVVDKNHEAPNDTRGHRFKGGFRFTAKGAGIAPVSQTVSMPKAKVGAGQG